MTTIASNPSPEPDHDRDAAAEAEPLIRAEEALAIEIISTDNGNTMVTMPTSAGTLCTALAHSAGRVVQAGARRRRAGMAEIEVAFIASLAESGRIPGVIVEDPSATGEVMLAEPDQKLVIEGLRTCAAYLRYYDLPLAGTARRKICSEPLAFETLSRWPSIRISRRACTSVIRP